MSANNKRRGGAPRGGGPPKGAGRQEGVSAPVPSAPPPQPVIIDEKVKYDIELAQSAMVELNREFKSLKEAVVKSQKEQKDQFVAFSKELNDLSAVLKNSASGEVMGGEASDIHENPFYKSSTYMQKLLNNIIMCGIKETYDNGCCFYTPSWLEHQAIKQLKEAGDRPLLLRTWKHVDLYQYLDFWTPLAPHLVTPAKKKKGIVAEPAGGFQYAKERYTAEIGKISTNMVHFVMTMEVKTKPPGNPPSTKLPPDAYTAQKAAFKAAEASFIKACEDFTKGGDAAAEPSEEGYFSYRRIPGNKSFIATEGAIQAMKSLLGVKGADPLVRVTLMQLALMDCKVLGRLSNPRLCRRAVGANQADEHQRRALKIFEDLLEEDCPEAPETPWEFNLPGLTIVCTAMCKGVITQMVQLGMEGELDGVEVSSKMLQRLGDDAGDGSFTKMALPTWFKHNRFQDSPQNAAALMEHQPIDLREEGDSDDSQPAKKKARVAQGLSSSDLDE